MAFDDENWFALLRDKLDEAPSKAFETEFWNKLREKQSPRGGEFRNWSRFTRITIRATLASVLVTAVVAVAKFSPAKSYVEKSRGTRREPNAGKRRSSRKTDAKRDR